MTRSLRLLVTLVSLLFLASCDWLLEEPLPRTNPSDKNAPVYYFRATPLDDAGFLSRVRLSWKWAENEPYNPGRVRIVRKAIGYPNGVDDTGAELVYSSSANDTEIIIDHGADQTDGSWYYTLFYEIDGLDPVYELQSGPTVFIRNSNVPIQIAFVAGFSFDDATGYGVILWDLSTLPPIPQFPVVDAPPDGAFAVLVPNIFELPSFNIDITQASFEYTATNNLVLVFQRITADSPDDQSPEYYYNRLNDSSLWTTADQVFHSVAGLTSAPGFEGILNSWLETLKIYGIRAALNETGINGITPTQFLIDYIGPPP